ncbi:MAG TPA: hypothetical protein VMT34_13075 [Aggregatilineales bacterium]|nr:hypothetical protein [Aggregatilineales bacterium]
MRTMRFLRREPPALPHLTIASRVVDKMVRNAVHYETETGESLVGFTVKASGAIEPELFVVETIPPDDSAIRQGAYFEQGDDIQGDIFNWWSDNWDLYREGQRNKPDWRWNVSLSSLGDWHKHPGTLTEPSWGDAGTAREYIHDRISGSPQLLVILATVWDSEQARVAEPVMAAGAANEFAVPLKVPIDEATTVRLDCWYMSRYTRGFVPLTPTVGTDLPELFPIAWHLRQPERARREVDALIADGFSVSVEQYPAGGSTPLAICLLLERPNSHNAIIVVTEADFPATCPTVRTAPIAALPGKPDDKNPLAGLWQASTPVDKSVYPAWNPSDRLVDFVKAIEAKR